MRIHSDFFESVYFMLSADAILLSNKDRLLESLSTTYVVVRRSRVTPLMSRVSICCARDVTTVIASSKRRQVGVGLGERQ